MNKRIRLILTFLFVSVMCLAMLVPTVAFAETDTETDAPDSSQALIWNYTDAFVYDGEEKTVTLAEGQVDFEKCTIEYSGNTATDAGEYTATAVVKDILTAEEVTSVTLEWKIAPYIIDLSEVVWDYIDPFVYSGETYTVSVAELPEFLDPSWVTLTDASAVNAGNYKTLLTVTLPEDVTNYAIKQSSASIELNWTINKADYDMSGVAFEDKSFRFNNRPHSIAISGDLPEGVTVSYSLNSAVDPGVYPVVATFAVADPSNYNTPAAMKAELHIRYLMYSYPEDKDAFDVKVQASEGINPSLEFVVNSMTHSYLSGIELDGKMMEVLSAYDISFTKGGDEHHIEGDFTLSLRIPKQYLGIDELYVVHINDNGDVEMIDPNLVTRDDRILVLTVDTFSVYAIVTPEVVAEEIVQDTPDKLTFILIAVLAVLIAIAIAIFLFKKNHLDYGPQTTPDEPVDSPDTTEASPEEANEEPEEETADAAPQEEPSEEIAEEEPKEEQEGTPSESVPEAAPVQDEDVDGFGAALAGETVLVRYRSSFQSRLIQSDDEIQSYYSVIKNKLLSYKGVKARTSWNYESFNKTKIQCAKVNIKGKAILLYINLDTEKYSATKYHFQNVSDMPKFADVPMLLKVKSERGLKYALELIEELMRVLEIPEAQAQDVDYRVPYETNEELAKRGLVKVILPKGMELDENMNLVQLNVSELLDDAKSGALDDEPSVDEQKPIVSDPVPEVWDHHQILHMDAQHADAVISDEEAEESIEHIHTGASKREGKLVEINLDIICENFNDGETVNLDVLIEKNLINKNAGQIKVLARGVMTKSLTVIASKFSLQAVKMITLAGGHAEVED